MIFNIGQYILEKLYILVFRAMSLRKRKIKDRYLTLQKPCPHTRPLVVQRGANLGGGKFFTAGVVIHEKQLYRLGIIPGAAMRGAVQKTVEAWAFRAGTGKGQNQNATVGGRGGQISGGG